MKILDRPEQTVLDTFLKAQMAMALFQFLLTSPTGDHLFNSEVS